MKLAFYGHSTFSIELGGLTIVTDPSGVGYPKKPARADVITESHQHHDHNDASGIACPRVLSTAGSWTIGGVQISTLHTFHDGEGGAKRGENLIFVFRGEGLTIAHLGDLGHVSGADELKNVDVLLLPIGGFYTIDTDEAAEVVRRVQPRVAIPMHFKTPCIDFPIEDEARFCALTGALRYDSPEIEITKETIADLPRALLLPWMES